MDELRETLVAELRERGVTYLAPSDAVATEPIPSTDGLLVALLEQPDIDLALEIADEDHSAFIAAIRRIKESLSLNIEEASPADFIPLPAGYRERSQFVGRSIHL
jgi:hypothetical protein